jgi:hypothetical protein
MCASICKPMKQGCEIRQNTRTSALDIQCTYSVWYMQGYSADYTESAESQTQTQLIYLFSRVFREMHHVFSSPLLSKLL